MENQLLISINEKLDRLLNPVKSKPQTDEELIKYYEERIVKKYAKKNLLKNLKK